MATTGGGQYDLEDVGGREDPSQSEQITNDEEPSTSRDLYSIFSSSEKLGIVLLVAFAAIFSPLSSYLYFPALTAIAHDLRTNLSKINITITSYMVVSGFAPMVLCSMADQVGRRPVYLLMFFVYALANIGLALQTSFPALLILRMVQSAGGSATVGLGYGVVGEITESSDRGFYMGILCVGPNTAPSLGPVLGGIIAQEGGWRWTFGFLAISGTLSILLIAVILPETARNIVGNGSLPMTWLNKSFWKFWQERTQRVLPATNQPHDSQHISARRRLVLPSPLESISICLCRDTAPVVLLNGVIYAEMKCLQASLSSSFIKTYHYTQLEAGLVYLPFGIASLIATLVSCT